MALRSGVIRGNSSPSLSGEDRRVQPVTAPSPGPWVETWLSTPRFAVYLTASGGDRKKALALYEWNSAISAALLHDLAHLEVGLRNAYDTALVSGARAGAPHWVFDAPRYFPANWKTAHNGTRYDANKTPRDQIDRAIKEAAATHATGVTGHATLPPPGKVIAELMFGFWRYLSVSAHHHPLWIPYLHKAFRAGTSRPQVDGPIGRLHKLRNRVAHHEPLLTQNLTAKHSDLLTLAGLISPELRDYIAANSNCPALIAGRP